MPRMLHLPVVALLRSAHRLQRPPLPLLRPDARTARTRSWTACLLVQDAYTADSNDLGYGKRATRQAAHDGLEQVMDFLLSGAVEEREGKRHAEKRQRTE